MNYKQTKMQVNEQIVINCATKERSPERFQVSFKHNARTLILGRSDSGICDLIKTPLIKEVQSRLHNSNQFLTVDENLQFDFENLKPVIDVAAQISQSRKEQTLLEFFGLEHALANIISRQITAVCMGCGGTLTQAPEEAFINALSVAGEQTSRALVLVFTLTELKRFIAHDAQEQSQALAHVIIQLKNSFVEAAFSRFVLFGQLVRAEEIEFNQLQSVLQQKLSESQGNPLLFGLVLRTIPAGNVSPSELREVIDRAKNIGFGILIAAEVEAKTKQLKPTKIAMYTGLLCRECLTTRALPTQMEISQCLIGATSNKFELENFYYESLHLKDLLNFTFIQLLEFFRQAVVFNLEKERFFTTQLEELAQNCERLGLANLAIKRRLEQLSWGELITVFLLRWKLSDLSDVVFLLEDLRSVFDEERFKLVESYLLGVLSQQNTCIEFELSWKVELNSDYDQISEVKRLRGKLLPSISQLNVERKQIAQEFRAFKDQAGKDKKVSALAKSIVDQIPTNALVLIRGGNASGKSQLLREIGGAQDGAFRKIIFLSSEPFYGGLSNKSTLEVLGGMTLVANLFARTQAARVAGLAAESFDLRKKVGLCQDCLGSGKREFFPGIVEECSSCFANRFTPNVLNVRLRGKTIAEILELTIIQAQATFAQDAELSKALLTAEMLEMGNLRLGRPILKIADENKSRLIQLALKSSLHGNLLLLDNPLYGLSEESYSQLFQMFKQLTNAGAKVVYTSTKINAAAPECLIFEL